MYRRNFFKILTAGGVSAALTPVANIANASGLVAPEDDKPATNIADAIAVPRTENSMPGKFPGKVVKAFNENSVVNDKHSETVAYSMLKDCMMKLTGANSLKEAWLQFVTPEDIIGLKVNPVAGKLLTTSHAVTQSIVKQLEEAGISRKNIVIWDRREMQLTETGYTIRA